MVRASRHRTTHSSIGHDCMAASLSSLYILTIARAAAELALKSNRDITLNAELERRYKEALEQEVACKVNIRLEQANKS